MVKDAPTTGSMACGVHESHYEGASTSEGRETRGKSWNEWNEESSRHSSCINTHLLGPRSLIDPGYDARMMR